MKKSIASSFIVNIVGLISLFIIDIYISRSNNIELISSWALTKSILFIGVLFVLLGLDQAIVRMKLKLQDIFAMAIIQFTIVISLMMGLIYLFEFKVNIIFIATSMFFLAISYIFYASYRLNMHYVKSQLFLQGWKVLLLFFLFIYGFQNYIWALPFSLFIILITFGIKELINAFKRELLNLENYRKYLQTGLHYFVSLLTLTASLYFDQLLLNYDGKSLESSQLFSHITFFGSPVIIFLGFAGFIIGPYLRNNPDKKGILFKKYFGLYLLIGILLSLGSYFIGYGLFSYFKPDIKIINYLSIVLVIVVFLRYLYILPSAYIGSFASNKLIRGVSFINAGGLFLYLFSYFVISRYLENYLVAILSSMLIVWLIRIINGYYAIYKILQEGDKNE